MRDNTISRSNLNHQMEIEDDGGIDTTPTDVEEVKGKLS
jgi:hypothetical protein